MNEPLPSSSGEGRSSPPSVVPAPTESPRSTFHWWHLEWGKIKPVWPSFLICLVLSTVFVAIGIYWLVDRFYSAEIRAKDATIQSLQSEKSELKDAQQDVRRLATELSSERKNTAQLAEKLDQINRALSSEQATVSSVRGAYQLAESNRREAQEKLDAALDNEKLLIQKLNEANARAAEIETKYANLNSTISASVNGKVATPLIVSDKKRVLYDSFHGTVGEGTSWSDPLTGIVFGCAKIDGKLLTVRGAVTYPDGKVEPFAGATAGKAWIYNWNGRRFLLRFSFWIKPSLLRSGILFVDVQETTDDVSPATFPATAPRS